MRGWRDVDASIAQLLLEHAGDPELAAGCWREVQAGNPSEACKLIARANPGAAPPEISIPGAACAAADPDLIDELAEEALFDRLLGSCGCEE